MPRILYLVLSQGGVAGGQKMMVRHVETLRELGFDAACYIGAGSKPPAWFSHKAPVDFTTTRVRPDDIIVLPDDAHEALQTNLGAPERAVILAQNPYYFAAASFDVLDRFPPAKFPTFMAVGGKLAATIGRAYPQADIELVPCFADERLFQPAAAKRKAVAFTPRKRPLEAKAIRALFRKLHPAHADLAWAGLHNASEAEVAEAFGGSSLFLSLSRLESVGMTTLEAMASGCLCAGFTGVGGLEYATPSNGFWVADDDCEAAADALARAADLVRTGGPALARHLDAAQATARQWSYLNFRQALEAAWMRIAPVMRVKNGPLD